MRRRLQPRRPLRAMLDEARGEVAQVRRRERQLEHAIAAVHREPFGVVIDPWQVVVHQMGATAAGKGADERDRPAARPTTLRSSACSSQGRP